MAIVSIAVIAFFTFSDVSMPVNPPGGTYPFFLMKWSSRLICSAAPRRSSTPFSATENAFISKSARFLSSFSFFLALCASFRYKSSCLLSSVFRVLRLSLAAAVISKCALSSSALLSLLPKVKSSSLKDSSSASWVRIRVLSLSISKSFLFADSAISFSCSFLSNNRNFPSSGLSSSAALASSNSFSRRPIFSFIDFTMLESSSSSLSSSSFMVWLSMALLPFPCFN
mmetsp:Transcript_31239/g.60083  ORF Transcript_31239/g.60083 Transcript_31239/m.60083 type:complete len:227 (+) Transcript_31239:412-1092(+)